MRSKRCPPQPDLRRAQEFLNRAAEPSLRFRGPRMFDALAHFAGTVEGAPGEREFTIGEVGLAPGLRRIGLAPRVAAVGMGGQVERLPGGLDGSSRVRPRESNAGEH